MSTSCLAASLKTARPHLQSASMYQSTVTHRRVFLVSTRIQQEIIRLNTIQSRRVQAREFTLSSGAQTKPLSPKDSQNSSSPQTGTVLGF
jgi:hypothetical protein